MKKLICALLTVTLLITAAVPVFAAETGESPAAAPALQDGAYVPNQAIVLFKNSAIDAQTRPDKGDLEPVGSGFGDMMDASGSESDALSAADEEVGILKKSLGDDFVLEDTLVFGENKAVGKAGESVGAFAGEELDELTIALVSSDKYDTAELIRLLEKNKNVAKAEPNYVYYPTSFDDYSLNDEYSSYLYHALSPAAENTGGDSVDSRGVDPEKALSLNASSAWNKVSDTDNEVVVAVVDSGVLDTHEDLTDVMWTNPGNIGLRGKHGYNFADNTSKTNDTVGHGTHCAGVIAAQANNLKGVAGVASAANVKIMALQIMSGAYGAETAYCVIGAYNYIHKAVQCGVNVVAVNNSWGGRGYGTIFNDVVDRLGEDGVICCYAAGNESQNNDHMDLTPANNTSEYSVVVGAATIDGKRAPFSDYGKSSVDVFAPGVNMLSSVSYKSYFPSIYDAETLNATTEYYGEFNENTRVENGTVTPSVGSKADGSVKPFGSLQFFKQKMFEDNDEWQPVAESSLELSVEQGRHFVTGNPYRLKLTVKNAQFGEEYFVYFPFEKNESTTADNTAFSITAQSVGTTYDSKYFYGGEIYEKEDGRKALFFNAKSDNELKFCNTQYSNDGVMRHLTSLNNSESGQYVMDAQEAEGSLLGFGLYIQGAEIESGPQDYSIYIDSIAISKPDVEFDSESSYDVMSGTSMACPTVTGACGLIAALNPRLEGESGGDYAKRIRSLLLSCARQNGEFKELCHTGGYVDLSLLGEAAPVITDAVCDTENETITIKGENLFGTLTCRSLTADGAEDSALPSDVGVEYSDDGKQLVLTNAKALFSTYTAFTVTAENGMKGEGKFFLVKGQKQLDFVTSDIRPIGSSQAPPYLIADAEGEQLYGYMCQNGAAVKFDGDQFNAVKGADLTVALKNHLIEETGDHYAVGNDYQIKPYLPGKPIYENGVIYTLSKITPPNYFDEDEEYEDWDSDISEDTTESVEDGGEYDDGGDEEIADTWYLCTLDLNADAPQWTFTSVDALPEELSMGDPVMDACVMNGRMYCIAAAKMPMGEDEPATGLAMSSLDLKTGEWQTEPEFPAVITGYDLVTSNGRLYTFGGFTPDDGKTSPDNRALDSVYCFDGKGWSQKGDMDIVGRFENNVNQLTRNDATAQVRNGLVFVNTSVEGAGNVFLYNTDTDKAEPLYYTLGDSLSNNYGIYQSCAVTRDGIYFINSYIDYNDSGWQLWTLPLDSGAYEDPYADIILGDADGDGKVTIVDVTMLQQYLAEFTMPGTFQLKACDVNRDGFVDIRDVTALQRYAAGMSAPAGVGFVMDEVDPLSLWTETAPLKRELIAYVKTVTDADNPGFIPVKDRIAVFDMDGTLCCETDPGYFDHKLLYHRVMEDPDYKDKASDFEKEVCADIETYFETGVYPSGMDVRHGTAVASAFKGMTPAEFDEYVKAYRDTPMDSYTNMTNGQAFYKPMLQVVDYLQANDFKVYIISGTDRFITRGLVDGVLNIPLAQMIGSDESLVATGQREIDGLKYTFTHDDELITGGEFIIKNLKMNKVTAIQREIGQQPVLCFGNSSGDAAMANFTITNNRYKSGAFLLCCDDLDRENGNLNKAESMRQSCEENGWTAVSMKNDWTTIYGDGVQYTKKGD